MKAGQRPLRVWAVSFLNARPITWGLERGLGGDRFDLRFDLPARCADALANGEADLALVPVAACLRDPGLRVVPGVAVASRGPVRTVLLLGEQPWPQLHTIAVDEASRSSALLLQVLGAARGLRPELRPVPHDQVVAEARGDTGALVIGDAAFEAGRRFPHVVDLGAEWTDMTGLPFVYAAWAGRDGIVTAEDAALLRQSLDDGLAHRRDIALAWAEAHGGEPPAYERYLTENIRYRLGADELSGAASFFARAHAAGLATPDVRGLRLFDHGRLESPITNAKQALVGAPKLNFGAASSRSVDAILADAAGGTRLAPADAIRLMNEASTMDLGAAADARRAALHPTDVVTYIIDRNVNYTNVCVTRCKFCNFYRPPGHVEGYVLSREVLAEKLRETVALGGTQILLQGGLNPELPLSYYEDLFRWMKAEFPLALHGLSPEEIRYIAEIENLSIRGVLERLVAAGLDSVPGGGAEILDDEIRNQISPLKCSTDTWLEVMRQSHQLGLRTTATLVFGFGERPEQLVAHLDRVRALQDETAGFTAFICWSFQAEGTRLKLKDDTTAARYLRVFALSRLYLDNVPHLQVSWPTMGPEIGQIALRFGGDDFGSAMIEENVVSQAGAVFKLGADDIERQIRAAGFQPRRRNMRYELLPRV